jgi:hypothetical protein
MVKLALKRKKQLLQNGKSVVVISLDPVVISQSRSALKVVALAPNAPKEDDPVIGSHNPEKK